MTTRSWEGDDNMDKWKRFGKRDAIDDAGDIGMLIATLTRVTDVLRHARNVDEKTVIHRETAYLAAYVSTWEKRTIAHGLS